MSLGLFFLIKPCNYPTLVKKKGDYIFEWSLKFLWRCPSSLPFCCTKNWHSNRWNNAINLNKPSWAHAVSSAGFCELIFCRGSSHVSHFLCVCACVCVNQLFGQESTRTGGVWEERQTEVEKLLKSLKRNIFRNRKTTNRVQLTFSNSLTFTLKPER